jgi:hypothetical protein
LPPITERDPRELVWIVTFELPRHSIPDDKLLLDVRRFVLSKTKRRVLPEIVTAVELVMVALESKSTTLAFDTAREDVKEVPLRVQLETSDVVIPPHVSFWPDRETFPAEISHEVIERKCRSV